MKRDQEVFYQIQERFENRLEDDQDYTDEQIYQLIEETINGFLSDFPQIMLSIAERQEIRRRIFNSARSLGLLTDLLEDRTITEIMVNGLNPIYIERAGRIEQLERHFSSQSELENIAQRIAGLSDRTVNTAVPIVDSHLKDGSRVCIVLPPAAPDGPIITIRKFSRDELTLQRMTTSGTLTQEAAQFLKDAVKSRYNIFISGGTGAGKTTFLNALSEFIPAGERVVTIEDSLELQLSTVKNLVRLEGRAANLEHKNAITIRDLIRASLRLRPDRIIVGEVRDAAAIDMLQAMNTGHAGSLSTGHANSAADMLQRLATMCLLGMENMPLEAIYFQIASALELIVHLERMRDGSRRVVSISEVDKVQNGQIMLRDLYTWIQDSKKSRKGEESGRLVRTQETFRQTEKMHAAGIWTYG